MLEIPQYAITMPDVCGICVQNPAAWTHQRTLLPLVPVTTPVVNIQIHKLLASVIPQCNNETTMWMWHYKRKKRKEKGAINVIFRKLYIALL